MKFTNWKLALLTTCLFATSRAPAQITSINVVGYINTPISPGDNLIANQLSFDPNPNSPFNTLNNVLTNGVVAGSTFSEWDSVAHQLLPASFYNGSIWSIDYTFGPNGIGGVLNSPSATTVTTVGNVVNYIVMTTTIPGYTFVPPDYGPGTYLLALAAPLSGAHFEDIIGRAPNIGDSVTTLDGPSQNYSTTTFNGTTWSNGDPSLRVDQSAYFTLVPVPEPSTLALASLGAVTLVFFRRRNSQA